MKKTKPTIEKLDATAREICRLFAAHERVAIILLIKGLKKIEVAFVIAFAADRMATSTRSEFVKFLDGHLRRRQTID